MTSDIVITASNTLSIIKPKRKIDRKNRKVTPAERNTARIFKELFILAHQLPDLHRKHRRLTSIEWINILTSSNNDYQHFPQLHYNINNFNIDDNTIKHIKAITRLRQAHELQQHKTKENEAIMIAIEQRTSIIQDDQSKWINSVL